MLTLLRNSKTGAFFKTATEWTPNQKEARDFVSSRAAVEQARDFRFTDMEIVSIDDDGKEVCATSLDPLGHLR